MFIYISAYYCRSIVNKPTHTKREKSFVPFAAADGVRLKVLKLHGGNLQLIVSGGIFIAYHYTIKCLNFMCGVPLSVSHVRLMLRSQHMTWEGNCLQPPPEGALQRRREGPGGSCTCLPAAITPTPSHRRLHTHSDKSAQWPRSRMCLR